MLIFELINKDLNPLRPNDTLANAVSAMEAQGMYYYPIVDESTGKYLGEVSLDSLSQSNHSGADIVHAGNAGQRMLRDSDHILEAARTMLLLNRTYLPVTDRSGTYLGTVTKAVLIESIVRLLNLREHGSVIMIEMDARDYMLSDVIRIIEVEGARILSLTIQAPDSIQERFRVSVKLNLDDLARVGSALRRYGYLISSESHSDWTDLELSDKADEFLRFLDI
jgi:predicted transcriptional regulator